MTVLKGHLKGLLKGPERKKGVKAEGYQELRDLRNAERVIQKKLIRLYFENLLSASHQ